MNVLDAYETESLTDSASYARSCYASKGRSRTWQDCSSFAVSKLPTKLTNTSCPFPAGMCTAPAIQLDTGLMDSDLSFGITAQYRKVTSRAPIEVSKSKDKSTTTSVGERSLKERLSALWYSC